MNYIIGALQSMTNMFRTESWERLASMSIMDKDRKVRGLPCTTKQPIWEKPVATEKQPSADLESMDENERPNQQRQS